MVKLRWQFLLWALGSMKTGGELAEIEEDANRDDSVWGTLSHEMMMKPITGRATIKLQVHSFSVWHDTTMTTLKTNFSLDFHSKRQIIHMLWCTTIIVD